jgi:hypothetical protein
MRRDDVPLRATRRCNVQSILRAVWLFSRERIRRCGSRVGEKREGRGDGYLSIHDDDNESSMNLFHSDR